jgi:transposase
VRAQDTVNADETSWKERRRKAWLWVAVAQSATIFMIHARRGKEAAKILLGSFAGVLGSDRWCGYVDHPLEKRQLCWAHLRRHFEEFALYRGPAGAIGSSLLLYTTMMFSLWHKSLEEAWSRTRLQLEMAPLKQSIGETLVLGTSSEKRRVATTCRELVKHGPALWTFLYVQGVEPTNNAAERALRHAVIMRKTSFGTHSERGSRFIERMLSTVATLRQQTRSVLEYLEEACQRAVLQRRPRSLLPHARIMTPEATRAAAK